MTEREEADGSDLPDAWRRGKPADVEVVPSGTSVLSIRIPSRLLQLLSERARREGKPASVLARELIEQALLVEGPRTAPELARAFARWVEEWQRAQA